MARTNGVKPIQEAHEISAITYGFMASKALFAALEFDLFTQISRGADSVAALMRRTGIVWLPSVARN
jgi:2-hydroxy-4-(methylsulfanyl)butanoate S-methyltransferase